MSSDSDHSYVPSLVFIETTKACEYSCRHCRAESQSEPSPDELTTEEMKDLLKQIRKMSSSPPEVVITGGDFLLRKDIGQIIEYIHELRLPFSASPAASPLLTDEFMKFLLNNGVKSISLSLDGTADGTHDWLRRIPGSFDLTLNLIMQAKKLGLRVQVNTTVIKKNLTELPFLASMLHDMGISTWEVFFLIKTGRGIRVQDISPAEYMQVNLWLSDLREYGLNVRTVEGPVYRVIRKISEIQPAAVQGELYRELKEATVSIMGLPENFTQNASHSSAHQFRGTLFVGHNGDVYPSGLYSVKLGSIRESPLKDIINQNIDYLLPRESGKIQGRCGRCQFMQQCGGSRARALSYTGNPFAEDPACLFVPAIQEEVVQQRQH